MGFRATTRRSGCSGLALACVISVGGMLLEGSATAQETELVSTDSSGIQGNAASSDPLLVSADGRYVAFSSVATNLVPGDSNGESDIFVRDRKTGSTERVSVASDGTQANSFSSSASMSADGRYVAFSSNASNLVPGDTNGAADIFVYDRQARSTARVNLTSTGEQATGGASGNPSISADGRYVAFASSATNLVPGDTNGTTDVFVRDRQTGTTQRVSVSEFGNQVSFSSDWPSLSRDGRYVAFVSQGNLVFPDGNSGDWDVFVYDRQTSTQERVSLSTDAFPGNRASQEPSISGDGRYVAFVSYADNLVLNDTNGASDVFVRDRVARVTKRVSVSSDGTQGNPWTVYPTISSYKPQISASGIVVAFSSYANNLVPGDANNEADIFIHDQFSGVTEVVSVSGSGDLGNHGSYGSGLNANGRYVAFASYATNLTQGGSNGLTQLFLRDRGAMARLANISTRGFVGTAGNAMVGGFVIGAGTGSKQVLLRGFGPTLTSFGISGALSNPVIELYADTDGNPSTPAVLLASNNDYRTAVAQCTAPAVCAPPAEIVATGMSACEGYAPSNPNCGLDAALLVTLPPGAYTVNMKGVNGGTGVGLLGVDDIDLGQPLLVNISTRAFVGTGSNVAVGGFIISGTTPTQVLLRGFGPTLSDFGVPGPLANPVLDLYADGDNNPATPAVLVATNDNWAGALTQCSAPIIACGTYQEIIDTGMSANSYAPLNSYRGLDAALLVTLPPGTYTARLRGGNNGTGVGLIGIDQINP